VCIGSGRNQVAASLYTGLETDAEKLEKDVEFRRVLAEDFALPPKERKEKRK